MSGRLLAAPGGSTLTLKNPLDVQYLRPRASPCDAQIDLDNTVLTATFSVVKGPYHICIVVTWLQVHSLRRRRGRTADIPSATDKRDLDASS